MVEFKAVNYVLLSASIIVFLCVVIGCIILVAKEKRRWDRKKLDSRRQYHCKPRLRQSIEEEPQVPSTVVSPTPSMTVSLRGINEWHLLPPIRHNFKGYTVDSDSTGYRTSMA